MVAPILPRPPATAVDVHGPYIGVVDSLDPTVIDRRTRARELVNVYPADSELGEGLVGRPGCVPMGATGTGAVQRNYQYTKLDGTEITLRVVGGEIEVYDWTTDTWTTAVSAADLSGAGITLSNTARVYCVTFADLLIVSDGAHSPFAWDGTTGGGLTPLTNCPPLYGQPTVYYAKLFGIKADERSTLVWSEENDPETGYEAGGFNNSWTLGQTDQEPLHAIRGTNEALYYWRARSTGAIVGAANDDFRTSGTHEAVSLTIGTTSPDAVVQAGGSFWLLDADARPQRLPIGGRYVGEDGGMPPWAACKETVRRIPRDELPDASGAYDETTGLVLLGMASLGSTENDRIVTFDPQSGEFTGRWNGYPFRTLDVVKDAALLPTLLHGDASGDSYLHGKPQGDIWDDELRSGTRPIHHVVEAMAFFHDVSGEKFFDRLDITLRLASNMSNVLVDYLTPYGRSAAVRFSATGGFFVLDLSRLGTALTQDAMEKHFAVGWEAMGRWIMPRIVHEAVGEQFGFLRWAVTARPASREPSAA